MYDLTEGRVQLHLTHHEPFPFKNNPTRYIHHATSPPASSTWMSLSARKLRPSVDVCFGSLDLSGLVSVAGPLSDSPMAEIKTNRILHLVAGNEGSAGFEIRFKEADECSLQQDRQEVWKMSESVWNIQMDLKQEQEMWCLKEERKHVFKGAGTWCLIKTNNFPRLSDLFRFMGYLHAKLSFLWCSLFYFLQSSLRPCFHSFLSFIPSSGLASFVVSSFLFCWMCLPSFFLFIFPYFVILSSSLFCRSSCFHFIFLFLPPLPLFKNLFCSSPFWYFLHF